jgi:hypothetical protein
MRRGDELLGVVPPPVLSKRFANVYGVAVNAPVEAVT